MFEFFQAAVHYSFLQYALLAGALSSVACGVVGSYVVTRRITYVAGAMAHFVLGGMGLARYLQVVHHISWLEPLHGAIASALLAAGVISRISRQDKSSGGSNRGSQREDSVISAIWAVGMAVGIIFIWKTPGYNEDLMSYLFGNILMVTPRDLFLIALLDLVVVLVAWIFYSQLMAVCFDEEHARLRGIRVDLYYLLLLIMTALTVVLLVSVVGIVLVIALISLPAATAGYFTNSLSRMMLLATAVCLVVTTLGLALSYGPGWPAGATIIILAGLVYLGAYFVRQLLGVRYRKKEAEVT